MYSIFLQSPYMSQGSRCFNLLSPTGRAERHLAECGNLHGLSIIPYKEPLSPNRVFFKTSREMYAVSKTPHICSASLCGAGYAGIQTQVQSSSSVVGTAQLGKGEK